MTVENEQKPGPFGGLSAAEAGRKGAETRRLNRERRAEAGKTSPSSNEEIERSLRLKAEKGDVSAARALVDLGAIKLSPDRSKDQRLLELLTPAQRKCLEYAIRDELAPEELVLEAFCGGPEVYERPKPWNPLDRSDAA